MMNIPNLCTHLSVTSGKPISRELNGSIYSTHSERQIILFYKSISTKFY